VTIQKFSSSVQQVHPAQVPEQNRAEIMDFQRFLETESREEGGRRRTLGESRIEQAIAAERKSPACEEGEVGDMAGKKRTRPSAQYTANGLASPGH
jgi:hypothetical protein